MALVREHKRFSRYVFSVQYYGNPFLGFSFQGPMGENCINKQGVDLRGFYSVEGKIRLALNSLVNGRRQGMSTKDDGLCMGGSDSIISGQENTKRTGELEEEQNDTDSNFENFQVSSRTDRGVHAWKNTFHVDIRSSQSSQQSWQTHQLMRGLNFHLKRGCINSQPLELKENINIRKVQTPPLLTGNEIRILSCKHSPLELMENKHYNPDIKTQNQPSHISWNARFSAFSRTYFYRILVHSVPQINSNGDDLIDVDIMEEFGVPFEDKRSWRVVHTQGSTDTSSKKNCILNIANMREASNILTGTNDYSSFRGPNCSRSNPIVTIEKIEIHSTPVVPTMIGLFSNSDYTNANIVTVVIKGNAFLYRQVRNIVGCLVEVGKNRINPNDVEEILHAKDRRKAPAMAPAHGLYLANVEHHNLII
jgi:tRNA pseudouridine(38-40) synthase